MEHSQLPLLIRADANGAIGAGHIMRCLALAQEWLTSVSKVIFLTACESEALRQRLVCEGLEVVALSDPGDWRVVAETLADHPGAWVALDGYHFSTADQQRIKDAGHRLLAIDDLAHLENYVADLVVNQNLGAQGLTYTHHASTRLLRGTDYVLLRKEFLSHRNTHRETSEHAHKVLVTLGGADPDNATLTIVRALQHLDADDTEVVVALGASYPHIDDLQAAIGSPRSLLSAPRFTLLRNAPNMSDLMAWADIALSAGGTTAWELAFMGVPSLAVILAPNQQRSVDWLSALGVVQNLGWHARVTGDEITRAVQQLQLDRNRRKTMSAAGQALVDGLGVQRVIAAMNRQMTPGRIDSDLRLRPVTPGDTAFLWRLTNDPTVRATSYTPDPVPYERHVQWLAGKLASPDARMWILEIDQEPVAQIRYDRWEPDMAEVGFSVIADLRGRSLGTRLLQLTGDLACQALHVRRLRGRLFAHNTASARAFVNAGYRLVEEFEIDQVPSYAYERSCSP